VTRQVTESVATCAARVGAGGQTETVQVERVPERTGAQGVASALALRYTGAPVETIDLEVTIDAVDQLEAGQGPAAHLQLSAPLGHPRQVAVPRVGQGYAGVSPAPPAARVLPKADLVRTLLVKPGQTRFKTCDGLGGQAQPSGRKMVA
jgi:hypothetical protein